MNQQSFKYHHEILRRMRAEKPGTGADAASVKGLFRISRKGQNAFQDFFFPMEPRSPLSAKLFDVVVNVAETTDRWMRERAPI